MAGKQLIDLTGLKTALEKVEQQKADKSALATLQSKVDSLVEGGGEPNKIEKIKVNGTEQQISPADKSVDISVPTTVAELTDGGQYAKTEDVEGMLDDYVQTDDLGEEIKKLNYLTSTEIDAKITALKHAKFEEVSQLPDASTADENTLYLLKKTGDSDDAYDIYIVTGTSSKTWTKIDDTKVSLEGYVTSENLNTELEKYLKLTDVDTKVGAAGYIKAATVESTYATKEELEDYTPTEELEEALSLSDYLKTADLTTKAKAAGFATQAEIDEKYNYDATARKTLSQENFTSELKKKLEDIQTEATKVTVPVEGNGKININGTDKTVYTLPSSVLQETDIASASDISGMLDEVFKTTSS